MVQFRQTIYRIRGRSFYDGCLRNLFSIRHERFPGTKQANNIYNIMGRFPLSGCLFLPVVSLLKNASYGELTVLVDLSFISNSLLYLPGNAYVFKIYSHQCTISHFSRSARV